MASRLGQYQPHLRGSGPQAVVVHTFRALWIQAMLVLFVPLVIDFLTLCLLSFSQKPNLKCTKLIKCQMKKKWKVSEVSLQMCKLWVPPPNPPSPIWKASQHQAGAPSEGPTGCTFLVPLFFFHYLSPNLELSGGPLHLQRKGTLFSHPQASEEAG